MARKEAGGKSSQQNDFLEPKQPIIDSAVNVGTARGFNDGAATVSISLPAGSPEATSYTVTASTSGQSDIQVTGSSSPVIVGGLLSNTSYTFTATASNAAGTSPASEASSSVTVTTVPAAPSAPTASAGVDQDTLSWTAPADGGSAITTYYWESDDGKAGSVLTMAGSDGVERGGAVT